MTDFGKLSEQERRERERQHEQELYSELVDILTARRADGQPVSVQLLTQLLVDRHPPPASLSDDQRAWVAACVREWVAHVVWQYADEHPEVMTAAELQERAAYHNAEAKARREEAEGLLVYARERAKQEGVELIGWVARGKGKRIPITPSWAKRLDEPQR